MTNNLSVEFFETQFQKQVQDRDFALNPFEKLALGYLKGDILDLGAGLGNLSLEAGRRGHRVVAVDTSPTAVSRINQAAYEEGLPVEAFTADIETRGIDRPYDTIISIGVLMFFRRETALKLLDNIKEHIKPSGRAIVNVLVEGTTYMDMFHQDNYFLFMKDELERLFSTWTILESKYQSFPAPGEAMKEFSTVIAERRSRQSPPVETGTPAKKPKQG